ncbi:isopenicillin N synthase family dioxygenase [Pseudonocardia pini]|uniref:isopenicillin N synthase family dioxygenase n=1 Tax=Pseudonocardia pini TaxID=2758030 RepID=UPI001C689FCE|nr:2-oxoglutarate and iron-dependent oxygenase domain-containing protein [Pseudonocardia pini]
MSEPIRTVDLGSPDPTAVDASLREAGFLLVTGHGVPPGLAAEVRAEAQAFLTQPLAEKERFSARIGGRGWLAPGVEANGAIEGESVPDLKESLAFGPETPTGDPAVDVWFPPNVWPSAALRAAVREYAAHMRRLSDALLALCTSLLEAPAFDTVNPTWTFNVNRYPPLTEVGEPAPGQFRIGPHTDFGTVTVLDREPGAGGLQVHTDARGWRDAPYDPAALTINIGDLLALWSGGRWRSGRHRVLPPQAGAPTEELVSLVWFFELDHDAVVTPLDGGPAVTCGPFIRERLDAISVG